MKWYRSSRAYSRAASLSSVVRHVFNVAETRVIVGAQEHGEVVRDNAATLDIDRAIVIHFAHETAPELNGTDGAATPTREHTLDHTLQSPLY